MVVARAPKDNATIYSFSTWKDRMTISVFLADDNLIVGEGVKELRVAVGKLFAIASVALSLIGLTILAFLGRWDILTEKDALFLGIFGIGFGALTWIIVGHQSRNGAVWALAWAGLFAGLFSASLALAVLFNGTSDELTYEMLLGIRPADLPLPAAIALSVHFWAGAPALWLPLTLGLLLFPDGRAPGPLWRWLGWCTIVALGVAIVVNGVLFHPRSTSRVGAADSASDGILGLLGDASFAMLALAALLAMVSLTVRYRGSSGETRSQIRWIAWGGALFVIAFVILPIFVSGDGRAVLDDVLGVGAFSWLIASYGIAITKYRLYNIDIVISRTVTYGVLAVIITGVYALLVVGIGSWIGSGDESNLALSIAAVAVVAIAFEPLRNRVQHAANRLVFGNRASPYEVLAKATSRLAETGSPEETLARVTHIIADGTGAVETVLWLKVGEQLLPHSATPVGALNGLAPVGILDERLPELPGEAVIAVRHRDELLGALTITKPRGQSVTAADEKVLADVSGGSGLLLRNIGLNAELSERAGQLQMSRRRLVAAHDAERHRLERDLHDGAQQQVVALKVKLGIARTLAEREGAEKVAEIVLALATTTQDAVDSMREVAHGIYPPLLESEGLQTALSAVRRRLPVPVELTFANVGRYERPLEESLYFCILEVLNRAIDGGAHSVSVVVTGSLASIEFTVRHDGTLGDLVTVEDRLAALGGWLRVTSDVAENTVSGTLPAPALLVTA